MGAVRAFYFLREHLFNFLLCDIEFCFNTWWWCSELILITRWIHKCTICNFWKHLRLEKLEVNCGIFPVISAWKTITDFVWLTIRVKVTLMKSNVVIVANSFLKKMLIRITLPWRKLKNSVFYKMWFFLAHFRFKNTLVNFEFLIGFLFQLLVYFLENAF